MKVVKAQKEHSQKLIEFYKTLPAEATIPITSEKKRDFFLQYQIQNDDYTTYMLVDDNDNICGIASLLFREAWIEGTKQVIGYATDLKINKNRKAILAWTQNFLPLLDKEKAARSCKYIFTSVSKKQTNAYKAFIRPRKKNRPLPRYYLYRNFDLISVHGKFPFADKKLPGITIRNATYSDKPNLISYIFSKLIQKPIRFVNDIDRVSEQLDRFPNFKWDDFFIACDHNNRIIGCLAPWINPTVEYKISRYGNKVQSARQSLRLLSILGLTHRLPNKGQPLPLTFLTQFHADNPDIFYSLLLHAYDTSNISETLIYPHFKGNLTTMPPKSLIYSKSRFGLYCILSPDDPVPAFLKPSPYKPPPSFEAPFLF